MKPDITEYARNMTARDKIRTAWLSFLYGMAFTAGVFVAGALLVLLFDFGPKAARLFYTTYIGG